MRRIRHWIIATILIGTLAASACGDDKPTTPHRSDDDTNDDHTYHAADDDTCHADG